jgi:hypothetical protein
MEIEVDLYLAGLASDSARWKRLGRVGTLNFVEGALESLMAASAITREEALVWKDLLAASSGGAPARFGSSGSASTYLSPLTPPNYATFIEFISANEPSRVLPGVCSFQILGVERYDVQVAVVWRMLPDLDPKSTDELTNLSPFNAGPEMSSMEVSDDRGTLFRKKGGGAVGGGRERVGRMVFVPAPPEDATILIINWEDMNFEIPLGPSHD